MKALLDILKTGALLCICYGLYYLYYILLDILAMIVALYRVQAGSLI